MRAEGSPHKALDKKVYRKRVLLRMLTRPISLIPFLGGTTLLMGAWSLGFKMGATLFAGVVGVLFGMGTFLTKLLVGESEIESEVLQAMHEEAEAIREKRLDRLEKGLEKDGDPRTEQSLRELRVLASTFQTEGHWMTDLDTRSSFDILAGVSELFETCVRYLEITLQLWHIAQRMETKEVRQPILERRERLIKDVRESIRHTSEILARTQTVGMSESTSTSLVGLRQELDTSLEVAKQVQERIAGWGMNEYNLEEFKTK